MSKDFCGADQCTSDHHFTETNSSSISSAVFQVNQGQPVTLHLVPPLTEEEID